MVTAKIFAGIILGYLIGSIPFSFLIVKWTNGIDLHNFGDGNIGASNVARAAGKKAGVAAFLFDVIKGIFPVLFSLWVLKLPDFSLVLTGFAAIFGHNKSIFMKFKGGKGLSTTMGVLGTLVPIEAAILLIPLLVFYLILKHGIFSVMVIGPFLPVVCWLRGRSIWMIIGTILIMIFVYAGGIRNVKEAWGEIKNETNNKKKTI